MFSKNCKGLTKKQIICRLENICYSGKKEEEEFALDLTIKNAENLDYMITKIYEKLKMMNIEAAKHIPFSEETYEKIYQIYQYVSRRANFSPAEMQAIADELGQLRKSSPSE